jgi:putative restriction endonuclease
MTIVEAIAKVMRDCGRPMTTTEVFDAIIGAGLYTFHADDPAHVVRAQIRRDCKELSFPSASPTKYFTMLADGTYFVLPKPTKKVSQPSAKYARGKRDLGDELRKLHARYLDQFRERLLLTIKQPDPTSFELFGIAADASFEARDKAELSGRDMRFRLDVVAAYNYTCALTGLRLTTITTGSIVDAAHIHQFSDSRNDDPRNGMALCKNAHWLFDAGLWTLDDDYRVLVANERFVEESPNQKPLIDYQGERLRLPSDQRIWPDAKHLAWHRKKHKFDAA